MRFVYTAHYNQSRQSLENHCIHSRCTRIVDCQSLWQSSSSAASKYTLIPSCCLCWFCWFAIADTYKQLHHQALAAWWRTTPQFPLIRTWHAQHSTPEPKLVLTSNIVYKHCECVHSNKTAVLLPLTLALCSYKKSCKKSWTRSVNSCTQCCACCKWLTHLLCAIFVMICVLR